MKNCAHWAMWFEVVMSWNGKAKALKLGSVPPTPSLIPTIQISVPLVVSLVSAGAGGERSPYWRVEENVSQTILSSSSSCSTKGAHLGNEFVSAVLPASATPGPLALASATAAAFGASGAMYILAVASVSAS